MRSLSPPPVAHSRRRVFIAPVRLRQVLEFIEDHLGQRLSLQDLARVACMSRYHFCRGFHSQMGVPPYRYVSERRIASAARLLTLTHASIDAIARESGFRGVHQFATLFTRIAGMSPGRFRRAHRSSNDTACAHESTANCSEKSASNERVLLGTTCAENRFE